MSKDTTTVALWGSLGLMANNQCEFASRLMRTHLVNLEENKVEDSLLLDSSPQLPYPVG
jgi:hypothetical protein